MVPDAPVGHAVESSGSINSIGSKGIQQVISTAAAGISNSLMALSTYIRRCRRQGSRLECASVAPATSMASGVFMPPMASMGSSTTLGSRIWVKKQNRPSRMANMVGVHRFFSICFTPPALPVISMTPCVHKSRLNTVMYTAM